MALPKLGALCKVMSRITLVPKQDHIRRNCWATFFRDPCLFAATYKKANDFNRGRLDLSFIPGFERETTGRLVEGLQVRSRERWFSTFCF